MEKVTGQEAYLQMPAFMGRPYMGETPSQFLVYVKSEIDAYQHGGVSLIQGPTQYHSASVYMKWLEKNGAKV